MYIEDNIAFRGETAQAEPRLVRPPKSSNIGAAASPARFGVHIWPAHLGSNVMIRVGARECFAASVGTFQLRGGIGACVWPCKRFRLASTSRAGEYHFDSLLTFSVS